MKKTVLTISAMLTASSAFAYYGGYDDGMSGFAIFTLIVMIVYIILSIVVLVRWFEMTNNIKEIKGLLLHMDENPKLTFLIATGEKEKADKAALKIMVENLWEIYYNKNYYDKAADMDKVISKKLPKIERLGIELPDYVKSGFAFIDYINALTGSKVAYKYEKPVSDNPQHG